MSENIYTAINEIMNEVGYIKKKRASGLNYTYAGEAALIQAIRPEMVEHQVIMFVQNFELLSEEPYTTSNKKIMHDVKVKAEIVFHHAPSDTKIIVSALGEGADTSDKATNKAMTGAYKYALRQTFCIETGDDPDRERADRAPKQQPKQQKNLPAWVYDVYTTKENKPYVDLTDEELKGRQIGIGKALAKEGLADGAKQQYQQKAEAIALILEARS